jgi:hypothetical protein
MESLVVIETQRDKQTQKHDESVVPWHKSERWIPPTESDSDDGVHEKSAVKLRDF